MTDESKKVKVTFHQLSGKRVERLITPPTGKTIISEHSQEAGERLAKQAGKKIN